MNVVGQNEPAWFAELVRETSVPRANWKEEDVATLRGCANGDEHKWRTLMARRLAGEPLAYLCGELRFAGRCFHCDERAYITDPETIWLVAAVEREARSFHAVHRRWPIVAEFGFGGGALGITLKLALPGIDLIGLDIDGNALEVGRINLIRHGVDVTMVVSDGFARWPLAGAPDLIFGDPPWGGEDDLYDEERDAHHYRAMPAAAAFPMGGRAGTHHRLLDEVGRRAWSSRLILNLGVLPESEIAALLSRVLWHEVERPSGGLALLHAGMHRKDH